MPRISLDLMPRPQPQRTRRSHKNSKDGCPNCRAKRVKCGEELPSCLQCVRRKCRCGYLDFPTERLEQLALKNKSKLEAKLELSSTVNSAVTSGTNTPTDDKTLVKKSPSKKKIKKISPVDSKSALYSQHHSSQIASLASRTLPPQQSQSQLDPRYYEHQNGVSDIQNMKSLLMQYSQSEYRPDGSASASAVARIGSNPQPTQMYQSAHLWASTNNSNGTLNNQKYIGPVSNPNYNFHMNNTQHSANPQAGHGQSNMHAHDPKLSFTYLDFSSNAHVVQSRMPQQPTPPSLGPGHSQPLLQQDINTGYNPVNASSLDYQRKVMVDNADHDSKSSDYQHQSQLGPSNYNLNFQHAGTTNHLSDDSHRFKTSNSVAVSPKTTSLFPSSISNTSGNSSVQQSHKDLSLGGNSFAPGSFEDLFFDQLHDLYGLYMLNMQGNHSYKQEQDSSKSGLGFSRQGPLFEIGDKSVVIDGGNTDSRRSLIKVRDRERSTADLEQPMKPLSRVRSLIYSNAFHAVNQEFGQLQDLVPDNFTLWNDDKLFESSDNLSIKSGDQVLLNQGLTLNDYTSMSPSSTIKSDTNLGSDSTLNQQYSIQDVPFRKGNPLPNAVVRRTTFPRLQIPANLLHHSIESHVQKNKLKALHGELRSIDAGFDFRPVWDENDAHRFWLIIFEQAAVLDLYFHYFIDKSVNILVRASDAIVNGDDISLNLNLNSSNSQQSLKKFFQFFYNKQDLRILTRKSYISYGNLISKLRESIAVIGEQYTARMSLFSAHGCYVNPSPEMSSFFLMFTGTLMVLKKILDESKTPVINSSLRQEVMLINQFCLASRYPEYPFYVVLELGQTFKTYKHYVQEQIAYYESGLHVDEELQKAFQDPIFHHDLKELEKFLVKLHNQFYPAISECNSYYKMRHNYANDWSIHFASPALIFDLAYEWFRVYPGDKMSMGSKTNPLKRVLYLFFHALAKCLAHVLTPVKSLLIVDACNVTFTKVGMVFTELVTTNSEEYSPLSSIAMTLFKTISFFENRLRLFGFYTENSTVLNGEFLKGVNSDPPTNWKYRDIIHILPPKLVSGEQHVQQFSSSVLSMKNYAFMDELSRDSRYLHLIQAELSRQRYAIDNEPLAFLYEEGLSNHDFNPKSIINRLSYEQLETLKQNGPLLIEAMKTRIENLIASRAEVSRVVTQYGAQTA